VTLFQYNWMTEPCGWFNFQSHANGTTIAKLLRGIGKHRTSAVDRSRLAEVSPETTQVPQRKAVKTATANLA
jgi:hypothetical protein